MDLPNGFKLDDTFRHSAWRRVQTPLVAEDGHILDVFFAIEANGDCRVSDLGGTMNLIEIWDSAHASLRSTVESYNCDYVDGEIIRTARGTESWSVAIILVAMASFAVLKTCVKKVTD